ncbi:MAG: hypothetical protein GWP14_10665 [Actinobacteria bacterium]|nr:hypothetical protein [Actinomycetota bacterium]
MRNQMIILSVAFASVLVLGCKSSTPEPDSYRQQYTNQVVSMQHLREIGQAVYSYLAAHDGVPAPSLATLVEEGLLESENLISPMSGRGPLKTDKSGVPTEAADYIYLPHCFTEEGASKGVIMAYERPENYQGSSLSGDGTVALVSWGGLMDGYQGLSRSTRQDGTMVGRA